MVTRAGTSERAELIGLLDMELPKDGLGGILDSLFDTGMARVTSDPEAPIPPAVRAHAKARHREGHDLAFVLSEYSSLRGALLSSWENGTWEGSPPGSPALLRSLNAVLDDAIVATVQEYRISTEMVSMVCHDLRNPLQSLVICASQLQRVKEVDPQLGKAVDVVMRATQRLNHVTDDLALFAAMDLGAPSLAFHEPRALLEEMVEAHRAAAAEKKVELEAHFSGDLRAISVDRNRVLRVMHHLIQHALKMSIAGSKIGITVSADERTTRFFVGHTGRERRSLDLSIARTLAGASGGEVRVDQDGDAFVITT